MASLSIEARVGGFVLAALVLLAAFVIALGDFRVADGFTLFADFAYAGNLQAGAPVRVSGIRVGRVRRLSLLDASADPPGAAPVPALGQAQGPVIRAELDLDEAVSPLLTEGAQVAVGLQGVVGEPYLELSPGRPGAAAIVEATAVRGVDAPELHRLVLEAAVIVDALANFSRGDGGDAGGSLAALLGTVNGILGERRSELSQAIVDLGAAAGDLRAILREARVALGDQRLAALVGDTSATAATLRRELPALLAESQQTVARLSALSTSLSQATDEGAIEAMVADTREATQNLAQLSRDGRAIIARIEAGRGTVGGLVSDPQVYDDIKEMLRDLKRHPWKLLWRD